MEDTQVQSVSSALLNKLSLTSLFLLLLLEIPCSCGVSAGAVYSAYYDHVQGVFRSKSKSKSLG